MPNAKKSNEMNKNSEQLSSRSRRARRERSVIITEYESDKTSRTKQLSQLQTWRNHSLNATRKEVDEAKKMKRTIDERETARYRDEDEENKASNLAKIGGPRTENSFDVNTRDTMRMPETTSAQEVPQRITASRRENPYRGKTRGQVRVKTRLRCRTSQGKYKVVNYVDT